MKRCIVPTLAEERAAKALRVRRATEAGILGNRKLAFLRAAAANDTELDELGDLLAAAHGGCLKSQVRCLRLYGKTWQRMAAVLAAKSEKTES